MSSDLKFDYLSALRGFIITLQDTIYFILSEYE